MKFCTNCGAETKPGQKICTQCGKPLLDNISKPEIHSSQEPAVTKDIPTRTEENIQENNHLEQEKQERIVVSPPLKEASQSETHYTVPEPAARRERKPVAQKKNRKKSLLPLLIVLLLLIGLAAAYFIGSQMTNPEKHAEKIITAINEKDYTTLQQLISSEADGVSKEEAKAYATLINEKGMSESFDKGLHDAVNEVKTADASDTPEVSINDNKLMTVAKQGKKFLIFDNYVFKVPMQKVKLHGTEEGTLQFKINGENHTFSTTEGSESDIGALVTGLYQLDATKQVNNETLNGKLIIDTTGDPQTEQQFDGLFVKVEVTGDDNLDAEDTKIMVNGDPVDYNPDKLTYGPFNGEQFEIYAAGELEGKNFTTTTTTVTKDDILNGDNSVTLNFDTDEIDSYIAEKNAPEPSDDSEDSSDESNDNSVIITSPDDALDAVRAYEDTSDLADPGQEIRTPVRNAIGWGFGIFEDGEVVKSYDVKLDGTVIEYDADAEEVSRYNPYE
ncbi:TcaA second domain-containing protein [Macrococcus equi]|uniref:TcaA second domain-containing protein n=1 Tax=Macrococcus equi TaxID=3395462 RepID=UPI0039BEC333